MTWSATADAAAERAVVIPAYNEAGTIRDVAERALAQRRGVIVVDDGSSDGTAAAARRPAGDAARATRATAARRASLRARLRTMRLPTAPRRSSRSTATASTTRTDVPRAAGRVARDTGRIVIGSRLHDSAQIPAARYRANRFANFWIAWAAGHADRRHASPASASIRRAVMRDARRRATARGVASCSKAKC